jgi:hypothetical protein
MLLKECFDQVSFMRREVVQDHVDLSPVGLGRNNLLQETNKLLASVARGGLPDHLAGLWIQGRVQRECAVPVILKAVLLGPPWR